jgi:hypothetical protein
MLLTGTAFGKTYCICHSSDYIDVRSGGGVVCFLVACFARDFSYLNGILVFCLKPYGVNNAGYKTAGTEGPNKDFGHVCLAGSNRDYEGDAASLSSETP